MNINTYKILKYINKNNISKSYQKVLSKFDNHRIPDVKESIFKLKQDLMVDIEYSDTDENWNPINPSTITITPKGKEYIEERKFETKRHWESLLIPHPLNIIVSVVSAVLTVLSMNYLGLIK